MDLSEVRPVLFALYSAMLGVFAVISTSTVVSHGISNVAYISAFGPFSLRTANMALLCQYLISR